jgi:hypothetical protein
MTAVEWLTEQFGTFEFMYCDRSRIIKIAKEMEKEQIIDAWLKGVEDEGNPHGHTYFYGEIDLAKKYYNETFKNK